MRSVDLAEHANAFARQQHEEAREREVAQTRAHIAASLMAWYTKQVVIIGSGQNPGTGEPFQETVDLQVKLSASGYKSINLVFQDLLCLTYECAGKMLTIVGVTDVTRTSDTAVKWVTEWESNPDAYRRHTDDARWEAATASATRVLVAAARDGLPKAR